MTVQNSPDRFYVSLISCQVRVVRHTSYLLKCVQIHRLTVGHLLTFFPTYLLTIFPASLLTFFLTHLLTFFVAFYLDSRLRSGRDHWSQTVAVEVRQGTLASDAQLRSGRQRSPQRVVVLGVAGTTGRGREHRRSRLRSGSAATNRRRKEEGG